MRNLLNVTQNAAGQSNMDLDRSFNDASILLARLLTLPLFLIHISYDHSSSTFSIFMKLINHLTDSNLVTNLGRLSSIMCLVDMDYTLLPSIFVHHF